LVLKTNLEKYREIVRESEKAARGWILPAGRRRLMKS
jgi:hypothetical protein